MTGNAAADDWVYVVTDIECDGMWPGRNSMLSFASVAVSLDGTRYGEFEAVLETLPEATPDPDTTQWWATQPEAWKAATSDPEPAAEVMARFTNWVKALPAKRVFAASPLILDAGWIDYYLRQFTPYAAFIGPDDDDQLFAGPGLCIRSYASAVTGRPVAELAADAFPSEWFGDIEHTHRAIDDARGYANLLVTLAAKVRERD